MGIPAIPAFGRPEYPFRSPRVTTSEWETSLIPRSSTRTHRPRCRRSLRHCFGGRRGSSSSEPLIRWRRRSHCRSALNSIKSRGSAPHGLGCPDLALRAGSLPESFAPSRRPSAGAAAAPLFLDRRIHRTQSERAIVVARPLEVSGRRLSGGSASTRSGSDRVPALYRRGQR
jgi:hypothetical protein